MKKDKKLKSSKVPKRNYPLFKPFRKQFSRKRTSFNNSWTKITNPDLLEEGCVKLQVPGIVQNKSVISSSSLNHINHSSGSSQAHHVSLVRGTRIPLDSEEESVVSVSSEDLERDEDDEIKTSEEFHEDMNKALGLLFQPEKEIIPSKRTFLLLL